MALGLPAPAVASKVANAGERIWAVDEALGKTIHEAGRSLGKIAMGLDAACHDMFKDLDQIAKG